MRPLLLGFLTMVSALQDQTIGPWDLDHLFEAPGMRWEDRTEPVQSLIYEGEPVLGADTEVFAFYASPATLDPTATGPFPAVVLVHAGGGTAFAEWVWLWAKRGYAAIAMDLGGRRPPPPEFDANGVPVANQASQPGSRTKLPLGGLDDYPPQKFDCIFTEDTSDDWPYHAAASVIRAHSLIRSFGEVDANRTAVTGISWGGYTTCLVASLDTRFKAAVPVYGCGFLHEGESVQKPDIDNLGDHRAAWVREYDPGSLLPRCEVPIFFVNGTNDIHYVLDSYQKSFNAVPGTTEKHMRIKVNMRHSHMAGWAPKEIGLFIDSKCRDGAPLAVPGSPVETNGTVALPFTSAVAVKSAQLHYTTDGGPRSARTWKNTNASLSGDTLTVAAPPPDANAWFISVTDDRDAMVSTTIQFAPDANVLINDTFDDGAVGTNTTGTGSGFTLVNLAANSGTASSTESGGQVTVTAATGNFNTGGIASNDVLSVTANDVLTITWDIAGATNASANGITLGVRKDTNPANFLAPSCFSIGLRESAAPVNTLRVRSAPGGATDFGTGALVTSQGYDGFTLTLVADASGWEITSTGYASLAALGTISGGYGTSDFVTVFNGGVVGAYVQRGTASSATLTLNGVTTDVTTVPEPSTLALSGFTYDPGTNTFSVSLEGAAHTAYILVEADDLDFGNPDQSPISLDDATATVCTLDAVNDTITTNASGITTLQNVSLGSPVKPATFIRGESAP